MREFVGVRAERDVLFYHSLKRDALLFKRIIVATPGIRHFLNDFLRTFDPPPYNFLDDLDWLFEKGIVVELEEIEKKTSHVFLSNLDESRRHLALYSQHFLRSVCVELQGLNYDAYPILYEDFLSLEEITAKKSDVVQIIVNALPVPDDTIAWEQIIEYRDDPATEGKFLALRNWMNDIARAKLPPNEIQEKIEWLLYDYQRHLHLHKMKSNASAFETIMVAGAELLENLVKLNWGTVAKGMFSLRHRKIALLEKEMTAPGSELAYVFAARRRFGELSGS